MVLYNHNQNDNWCFNDKIIYLCQVMNVNMKGIYQNLRDICRLKGLSLTDVANRMGVDPSNLLSSIKGNPTISRIQAIADALQISVSELLTQRPEKAQGLAIIDGQIYQLSRPAATTVQLPTYDRYDTLRKELKDFIKKSIKGTDTTSRMGMVETMQVFSLVYDPEAAKFYLSLCYADGQTLTIDYDKMEYCDWPEDESNDNATWNLADICEAVINDIEGSVPMALRSE